MNEKYLTSKIKDIIKIEDKELAEKALTSFIEEVKVSSYFQACNDISRQNYKRRVQIQAKIDSSKNVFRLNSKIVFK